MVACDKTKLKGLSAVEKVRLVGGDRSGRKVGRPGRKGGDSKQVAGMAEWRWALFPPDTSDPPGLGTLECQQGVGQSGGGVGGTEPERAA